jgi:SAM-dependent methyltransferase
MNMIPRHCPICGSADDSHVFAESNVDPSKLDAFAFASRKIPEYMHHRLIECPTCDLLYASPVPQREELAKAYEDAAFDSGAEARFAARTYGRFLPDICKRLPNRIGALDIGTGDGAFLEELIAMKFEAVVGVEPSSAPIASAASEIKPLILKGLFHPDDYKPDSFSLITCFQTMEHVDDPMAMCRGAMKLLKPGGALFLIGHNRNAMSAKLMGRKSPIFDIEHLQLFSYASARQMMSRAGFIDVRVTSFVNRYPMHYWMKLVPIPAKLKTAMIRFSKAIRIGYIPIPLPAGNMAIVGFRPDEKPTAMPVDRADVKKDGVDTESPNTCRA